MFDDTALVLEDAASSSSRTVAPSRPAATRGEVNYILRSPEKPAIIADAYGEASGVDRVAPRYEARSVRVEDARPRAGELTLDANGIALIDRDTGVGDFHDDAHVEAVYYPEVEQLLKRATGAEKVVVFDHTVRVDGGGEANGRRKAVRHVHGDHTVTSAPQRLRDILGEREAQAWLQGRFAIINVWRPIAGPVRTAPLAFVDGATSRASDFVAVDLVYRDRVGEIYGVAHDPDHRWLYFPGMQRNEAVLIKVFDSAEDGRVRFAAHSAFDDPATPANAAPRESIEVRTLVLFPPEAAGAV